MVTHDRDGTRVTVSSMVASRTGEPAVMLQVGDRKPLQMGPDEARSIAAQLLECAEAAEQDAFLVAMATRELGGPQAAAALLAQWRRWRGEREGGGHGVAR